VAAGVTLGSRDSVSALYAWVGDLARAGVLPADFQYPFLVRGFLCVLLLAPMLGGLSHLVVARRMAFFSAALGQAALTGVSVGLLLGEPLNSTYGGMFGFCLLTTLAMIYVKRRSALPPDTLIGVFLALSLGLGLCLLVLVTREFNVHQVESVLFGSLLTVTDADLLLLLAVGVSVIALLIREYNHLLLDSLNPSLGSVSGADPRYLDYFFAFLLAVSIVASLKIIGALLVEALIIVPAAAARNVARGTRAYLVWSVAIAFLAGVGGLGLSTKFQVPTGPAVVLGASLMFFGTLIAGSVGRIGRVGLAGLVTGRRAAGLAVAVSGVAIAAASAGAPRGTMIGILLVGAGAYFFKFGWPGEERHS
jgi:zinc transport system permease protein